LPTSDNSKGEIYSDFQSPPFRYPADNSDISKGGIYSGFQPPMNHQYHITPPFCHAQPTSNISKGGIWSGSQPQAEFEAAHCRRRNLQWLSATRPALTFYDLSAILSK